jgi:hypothetical protein
MHNAQRLSRRISMLRPLCKVFRGSSVWAITIWLTGTALARAEDVIFFRSVGELTITERSLSTGDEKRVGGRDREVNFAADWQLDVTRQPYGSLDGPGEIYLDSDPRRGIGSRLLNDATIDQLYRNETVVFQLPARPPSNEVTGRLVVPTNDHSEMVVLSFKTTIPTVQDKAPAVFAAAKQRHFQRLLARSIPGDAWFRHQIVEARKLSSPEDNPREAAQLAGAPNQPDALEQTYALFSGGRAVTENLQLDRPLPAGAAGASAPAEKHVKLDTLAGITVAEMDWKSRIAGKTPPLDPLADHIPADQHALFLPSPKAAEAVLSEFLGGTIPILNLSGVWDVDSRFVQERYERQLGVSVADLVRLAASGMVKGMAVTGSDPYFVAGTDVALLLETDEPAKLINLLRERLEAACRGSSTGLTTSEGINDGSAFIFARTPGREICSYIAALDHAVVLTNSPVQLERILQTTRDRSSRLVEAPEYRFFRSRYPRGAEGETALLILTDATIRRWCGPRWRIASSRRVRAAAALAEVQAANLGPIVAGTGSSERFNIPPVAYPAVPFLGEQHVSRSGASSSIYGTLAFPTPIVEIPLEEVTESEAQAYRVWRDSYQRNWRGTFDPIALRLSVRPAGRMAADLTVMPLIASSDYREFISLVAAAKLGPRDGDLHPESLVHAIMALDLKSRLIQENVDGIARVLKLTRDVALGWIGGSIDVYLDDDPFWAEFAQAKNPNDFMTKNWTRLPVGVHVPVTDAAKLALFLSAVRFYSDQSAPDLAIWQNREHHDQRYVRVAERGEGAPRPDNRPTLELYYAATPRGLVVSFNEQVVTRYIDRQAKQQDDAKAKVIEPSPAEQPRSWLGESLAVRVSSAGVRMLATAGLSSYRTAVSLRCWNNLPILNEWHRLYPDRDPAAVHEAVWGERLACPAGGKYVWNPKWRTMESTVLGHPGEPRPGPDAVAPLRNVKSADFGITFQDGGLRAAVEIERQTGP